MNAIVTKLTREAQTKFENSAVFVVLCTDNVYRLKVETENGTRTIAAIGLKSEPLRYIRERLESQANMR